MMTVVFYVIAEKGARAPAPDVRRGLAPRPPTSICSEAEARFPSEEGRDQDATRPARARAPDSGASVRGARRARPVPEPRLLVAARHAAPAARAGRGARDDPDPDGDAARPGDSRAFDQRDADRDSDAAGDSDARGLRVAFVASAAGRRRVCARLDELVDSGRGRGAFRVARYVRRGAKRGPSPRRR